MSGTALHRTMIALAAAVLVIFGTALAVAANRISGNQRPSPSSPRPSAAVTTPPPTTPVPAVTTRPEPLVGRHTTTTQPKPWAPPAIEPPEYTLLPAPPLAPPTTSPPRSDDGVCTLNEARGIAGCPPGSRLPGPYVTEGSVEEPDGQGP